VERIGFVGLGIMGSRMAANLRRAGYELTVFNRTRERAEAFAQEHGATVADTPAAVARWRGAEALVAAADREGATVLACAALETAERLGAAWLAGELESLAARARLRMGEAGGDEAAAEDEGSEDPFGLTPRERQVLALVAAGATNREIGRQLYMAEKTASVHVSRILAKLDVRSRTEAAGVAHRFGLDDAVV
jgi:DNA-binding NarL/FixJ family response regulator